MMSSVQPMTSSRLRILYIEDELDIREVATLALQSVGGFIVEACSSGEQALRAVAQFRPNFILLDVMMPNMDGPTTLRETLNKSPSCRYYYLRSAERG